MSVLSEIQALAESVAGRLNAIAGRILPTGGTAGQIVTKTASGFEWKKPLEDFPMFIIQGNTGQGITQAFTTVTMQTITVDSHNAWDAANNFYVVPQDGIYEVQVRLRIDDGFANSVSCGCGVSTVNGDNSGFTWTQTPSEASTTGALRFTMTLNRTVTVGAGDLLRLYAYWDNATPQPLSGRELVIQRIR